MPTAYNVRHTVSTTFNGRTWVQTDLWYLITQLGILCDNNWNRIVFHTWVFEPWFTPYSVRPTVSTTPFTWRTPI